MIEKVEGIRPLDEHEEVVEIQKMSPQLEKTAGVDDGSMNQETSKPDRFAEKEGVASTDEYDMGHVPVSGNFKYLEEEVRNLVSGMSGGLEKIIIKEDNTHEEVSSNVDTTEALAYRTYTVEGAMVQEWLSFNNNFKTDYAKHIKNLGEFVSKHMDDGDVEELYRFILAVWLDEHSRMSMQDGTDNTEYKVEELLQTGPLKSLVEEYLLQN